MVTSALKMETVRFSDPEEQHQYRHRRENLKSLILKVLSKLRLNSLKKTTIPQAR
jgi:hypothetical protein